MVDPVTLHLWAWRALYICLALGLLFLHLVPLQTTPARIPAPDFLLAFTFAWIVRRPDQLPVLSVALVFFLADILLMKPPGLTTALVVLAAEFLRSRSPFVREFSFLIEWGVVAVVMIVMNTAIHAIMLVLLENPPPGQLVALQTTGTLLVYPLIVVICTFVLRVAFVQPGERSSKGYNQ